MSIPLIIGLAIIFVCGGFILLHRDTPGEPLEIRPEDDSQIVLPEIVSMDEYLLHKKERRNSILSIIFASILALVIGICCR